MRKVLVDSDNLFGPQDVIPISYRQIELLQQLRSGARGADARALVSMQAQFAEFAAWLHQDKGEFEAAQYWADRALEWSHVADDRELTTFVLARKSQLAGDMQDAITAVQVGEAAASFAGEGSRLAAVATTYSAHGYALAQDEAASARSYDDAHELLVASEQDSPSQWGAWLDESYIEVQRAQSLAVLGDFAVAAQKYERAIAELPDGYPRDRGVYLARAALAHAGRQDLGGAATLGLEALAIRASRDRVASPPGSSSSTISSVPSTRQRHGSSEMRSAPLTQADLASTGELQRPHVLLSVATSIDGYIDDTSSERLLLSNAADFDRVDQGRSDSEAILVGAGTLRADNPRLIVNSEQRRADRLARSLPEYPLKVTISASGDLDPALKWFHHGGERIVYTVDAAVTQLVRRLGALAHVVPLGSSIDLNALLDDLATRNVKHLMVEGGEQVHTAFLTAGLVDEIHLAIAPLLVGSGPRFLASTRYPWPSSRRMQLAETRVIDDVVLLRYFPKHDSAV